MNQPELHPSEIWHHLVSNFRSSAAGWLCCGAATVSLLGCLGKDTFQKVSFSAAALATAGAASIVGRNVRDNDRISLDYWDIMSQARQNRIYEATKPTRQPALVGMNPALIDGAGVDWFNWEDFKLYKDDYPHIGLITKTGGGKSWLAEWLSYVLKDSPDPEKGLEGALTVAVVPHYEYGDYATADVILGHGRNYGTSAEEFDIEEKTNARGQVTSVKVTGEPPIDFSEIIAGKKKPTVCQFLRSLHTEMNRRYQLNEHGRRIGGRFINVILDEFPAYANLEGVRDVIKELIREARKVGIRLILLAQGKEVKTLGIEGEGSLRENLTLVYLKKFALQRVREILSSFRKDDPLRLVWEGVLEKLQQSKRPALVEDMPCEVPDLAAWKQSTTGNPTMPIGFSQGQTRQAPPAPPAPPVDGDAPHSASTSYWQAYRGEPSFNPDDYDPTEEDYEGEAEEPLDDAPPSYEPDFEDVYPLPEGRNLYVLGSAESKLTDVDIIIVNYSKRCGWITARNVQPYVANLIKGVKAEWIRERFLWLAARDFGITRGEGNRLEFNAIEVETAK